MRSDWKTDLKVQAEDAVKRSRVWPWEWVGKDTGCCKSKEERISWNSLVQCELVSMWRLKSPVITKFWHVMVREDKVFWNWSKKTVSEPGGRYRLRIVKRDVPGPVATVQQIALMLDWWGRLTRPEWRHFPILPRSSGITAAFCAPEWKSQTI